MEFNVACLLVHLLLFSQAPTRLSDDIHLVSEGRLRRIRSSADKCSVPLSLTQVLLLSVLVYGTVGQLVTSAAPQLRSVQVLAEDILFNYITALMIFMRLRNFLTYLNTC